VVFLCENESCSEFNKEVELEPRFLLTLGVHSCKNCLRYGSYEIIHGDFRFNSPEALEHYLNGKQKELDLLKRLQAVNACTDVELIKIQELTGILTDALCPCCGRKFLE
jgi:hypothetical protein